MRQPPGFGFSAKKSERSHDAFGGGAADLNKARIVDADPGHDRLLHALLADFGNGMPGFIIER